VHDLETLVAAKQANNFLRRIQALEEAKILRRFIRGIYVAKKFVLAAVSQKICPSSYISQANVLANELLIGTLPGDRLVAMKVGKRREYISPLGKIIHLGIAPHLYFGFSSVAGIHWADKEKALLDTLYFYQKGERFYFDIYSDIDLKKINRKKLIAYLQHYKNPKFRKFVAGFMNENTRTK
jgi:hypothetical protein